MRLQTKNVEQFVKDLKELQDNTIPALIRDAELWMDYQRRGWDATYLRNRFATKLNKFRYKLGELYDFMADRGLRDANGSS